MAHGKRYVFTELTPDPTCLDSYTTRKRLLKNRPDEFIVWDKMRGVFALDFIKTQL